ncbi:MAG: hypothetical protein KAY37_14000, partial [Phycisphaerae bacterium]|nr:hypothetical protein [Phycisphaerae bacterium]
GNVGMWERGNVGTWERGNVGTWERGNVGTWERGNVGTWERGNVRRVPHPVSPARRAGERGGELIGVLAAHPGVILPRTIPGGGF